MIPSKAIVLPPIASLPSHDLRFRSAIDDVALLAEGLIMSVDAAMLAIPLSRGGSSGDAPLMAWNQQLATSATLVGRLLDTPIFTPALMALRNAADAVLVRLEAWRWTGCGAPGLCLMTDGTGVVLSTERPPADEDADEDRGWLIDLGRRGGRAITVRPAQAGGAWSLLAATAGTVH